MIIVVSKRKKVTTILKQYPDAEIIDLTSKAPEPYVQFSPFYPHGDIPIPFSEGQTAQSVEGVWQGLKVFESVGIDSSKFDNKTMRGLKRTVRKFGLPKGHQKGMNSTVLLDYISARKSLYLPMYHWVLTHKTPHLIQQLVLLAKQKTIIFQDYETNGNIDDPSKPLSHACLVKDWVEKLL